MSGLIRHLSSLFLILLVVSLAAMNAHSSLAKEKINGLKNITAAEQNGNSENGTNVSNLSADMSSSNVSSKEQILASQGVPNATSMSTLSASTGKLGLSGAMPNISSTSVNGQNQSEETSKPPLSIIHPLKALSFAGTLGQLKSVNPQGKILIPSPLQGVSNIYKLKVTFDSITVHDDHEGLFSGDGEYDLAVYVQGKKISLTDAGGSGGGLWDVGSGETVTFPPGTEVSVDVPGTLPLSIFTVGSEVDGCDRTAFPEDVQSTIVQILTLNGGLRNVADDINNGINWIGCKLNPNDILGVVNKIYEPTSYGEGSHSEKSDAGDFTLRYTISVTPPLPPAKLIK